MIWGTPDHASAPPNNMESEREGLLLPDIILKETRDYRLHLKTYYNRIYLLNLHISKLNLRISKLNLHISKLNL